MSDYRTALGLAGHKKGAVRERILIWFVALGSVKDDFERTSERDSLVVRDYGHRFVLSVLDMGFEKLKKVWL